MYRFLPYAPSRRTGGQFLRPVEAIGLTAEGSIKQLTAFDYAGSELRQAVVAPDEYAIPAKQRGNLEIKERPHSGGLSGAPTAECHGLMPAL